MLPLTRKKQNTNQQVKSLQLYTRKIYVAYGDSIAYPLSIKVKE
jgi:hypothetical protein